MKKQKLRYYLRGLGIGILVTALILGISGGDKAEMTDAQIRERALELGMVDSGSIMLSDLRENSAEESESAAEADEAPDGEAIKNEPIPESEAIESEAIPESEAIENRPIPENDEPTEIIVDESTGSTPEVVSITIYSGSGSYTVSKDLEEAGLVADAKDFDDYLCDMGYSKIVRTGTYKFTVGTSEEEIAKIITGKR